jgi:hypothetical protein
MLPVRTSLLLAVSTLALMIPHGGHAAPAPTPLLLTNEGPESAIGDLPLSPVPAPQKMGNAAASAKPAPKSAESAKNKPMTAPMPKSVLTPQQLYWEVKQSTLPDGFYQKGAKAPCIATKRQVQGNLIQMSAHQHRLYSLSFDADDLGVPAQRDIPVTLIFDRDPKPLQLMGQALTPMTVTVAMPDPAAVYARMENASYLTTLVRLPDGQSRQLRYDVTGIRTAFAEMERCSSEGQMPVAALAPVPAPLQQSAAAGEVSAAVPMLSSTVPARVRRAQAVENGRALPPPIWPGEAPADIVAVEPKSRTDGQKVAAGQQGLAVPPAADVSENTAESTLKREEIRVLGAKPDSGLSSGVMASKAASRMPVTVKDMTAQSAPVAAPMPAQKTAPVSAKADAPQKIVRSYRARPGESMRDVVRRWTERDGVDLVWAMPRDVTLSKEFSYTGELQTALTMLLSTYPEAGAKTTLAPKGVEIDKKPYIEESKAPAIPAETVKGVPLDEFVVPTPPPSDVKTVIAPVVPTPIVPPAYDDTLDAGDQAGKGIVPRHIPSPVPPPPTPKRVIAAAPVADTPEIEKALPPPIPELMMPVSTPRPELQVASPAPAAIPMRAPAPPPSSVALMPAAPTANTPAAASPGTALRRAVHDLYADIPAEEAMDGMAMDVEVPSFDETPAPIPMETDRTRGAAITPPSMPPVPARAAPVPAPIPMEQEDIDLEQMAAQMAPLHTPSKTTGGPVVAAKQAAVGPVKRWRALTGASLQQVMKAWAEESGTNLIWMSSNDFAVKYSVNKNADYGQAVADLLGQYTFEPVRPLGQLYQDPQTGQRTLVVR